MKYIWQEPQERDFLIHKSTNSFIQLLMHATLRTYSQTNLLQCVCTSIGLKDIEAKFNGSRKRIFTKYLRNFKHSFKMLFFSAAMATDYACFSNIGYEHKHIAKCAIRVITSLSRKKTLML